MATTDISQTNFIRSINRIDPTEGLVEYVLATKPYHSKVLDVLVEYVYAEDVNVTITEQLMWDMYFTRPDVETVYTCGYGLVWDPILNPQAADNILAPASIISAVAAIEPPTAGFENSNSFLIQSHTFQPFVVAVASSQSNQFVLSKNYDVLAKDIMTNTWEIDDPLNELVTELTTGNLPKLIVIGSDTGPTGNGKYTVTGTPTHLAGVTTVEVVEPIPVQALADGILHRPLEGIELPQWASGVGVQFSTATGTLPIPVDESTTYYVQPTSTAGFFNLTTKRYPLTYHDYLDVSTLGSGELFVTRNETYVPGNTIEVSNTPYGENNGTYVVQRIVKEGLNERIYVYQKVPVSANGGSIVLGATGFDQPIYCPPSQAADLHTDAFFHESLKFEFEINLSDFMYASYEENPPRGYGETPWGSGTLGPYGTYASSFDMFSAQTSGNHAAGANDNAHTLLPTGLDAQAFDVGGIDETLESVRHFYGRSI